MATFSVDLTGRVALVTYAGTPLGMAVAQALVGAGAAVGVHDVNPARLDRLIDAVAGRGGRVLPWHGDVSNRFQAAAMIEAVREAYQYLHIVVNMALVERPGSFLTLDEYDWRRALDLNMTAAFFCAQLAGRVMADEGGGVILNIGSTAGGAQPGADRAAFAASQAGLQGLTRAAARDLAPHGVRVNGIAAAVVAEPAGAGVSTEAVATTALFLCSDAAAAIVGQTVVVDGGAGLG